MRDPDGGDGPWAGYTDPLIVPLQIDALQELELRDHQHEPYSEEELLTMLRSTLYHVDLVADLIVGDPVEYTGSRTWQPLTGEAAAIDELRCRYSELSWSTVADAYRRAKGYWRVAMEELEAAVAENRV
jgi:hypothetical protein